MKIIWGCVVGGFIWALVISLLISTGHSHDWIVQNNFRNAAGTLCCDWVDCAPISMEEAWTKGIGSTVIVPLATGPVAVVINAVHPSYDPQGQPIACTTGCLLRPLGY